MTKSNTKNFIHITWTYTDKGAPTELPQEEWEHICEKISEGYVEGELHYTNEKEKSFNGWWTIKRGEEDNG